MFNIYSFKLQAVIMALPLALTACGGGGESIQPSSPNTLQSVVKQMSTFETEGARLNSQELAEIATTGVRPMPFNGPLLVGSEVSLEEISGRIVSSAPAARLNATLQPLAVSPSLASAYRFYNTRTGGHVYTISTVERDNVIATLPFMNYEGPAFFSSNANVGGLSPVHRFFNTLTGVHFYTISENERAYVAANIRTFLYEGIAYYASPTAGAGLTPLYRFYNFSKGFHFYTASLVERDQIIATSPTLSYEGIGYYVLNSDWQATVPVVPQGSVYIADFGSNTFNLVNLTTGALIKQTSLPLSCNSIVSATVGSDGVAIGVLFDGGVVKFDPVSGRCDPFFTAPERLSTIAVSPTGNLVAQSAAQFFAAYQIYTFSPTGAQISKVPLRGASSLSGLVFADNGVPYGPGFFGWFSLSASTGVTTQVAGPTSATGSKICVDKDGVAYAESFGILYRYNLKTGVFIGQIPIERNLGGAIVCR